MADRPPIDDVDIEFLVASHTAVLYRTALGLGFDPTTAEELVQSAFVTFWEARHRFEGRSKPSTFLFGILYNKVREFRRAQGKEPSLDALEEDFDGRFASDGHWGPDAARDLSDPERRLHNRDIGRHIDDCLSQLPMAHRMAFTLKEVQGLKTPTLCQALDVSPNHLGVLLFRARNALRDCLETKSISA